MLKDQTEGPPWNILKVDGPDTQHSLFPKHSATGFSTEFPSRWRNVVHLGAIRTGEDWQVPQTPQAPIPPMEHLEIADARSLSLNQDVLEAKISHPAINQTMNITTGARGSRVQS